MPLAIAGNYGDPTMPEKNEFLTIPEAAKLLRIAERTLYTLARERRFPAMKVGDQWRISRAALDEWGRTGGAPPVAVKKPSRKKR